MLSIGDEFAAETESAPLACSLLLPHSTLLSAQNPFDDLSPLPCSQVNLTQQGSSSGGEEVVTERKKRLFHFERKLSQALAITTGCTSIQGIRPTMEDTHILIPDLKAWRKRDLPVPGLAHLFFSRN